MLLIRWSTYEPESGQFDETSQHHPVLPKQRPGLACPPRSERSRMVREFDSPPSPPRTPPSSASLSIRGGRFVSLLTVPQAPSL